MLIFFQIETWIWPLRGSLTLLVGLSDWYAGSVEIHPVSLFSLLWTNLNFWHPMPCLLFKCHAKVAFGNWALPQTSLEDVKVLPSPCRAARGRWKGGGFRWSWWQTCHTVVRWRSPAVLRQHCGWSTWQSRVSTKCACVELQWRAGPLSDHSPVWHQSLQSTVTGWPLGLESHGI